MKAKVLLIGSLWLSLCGMLDANMKKTNDQSFPLDMVVDSVDDMYFPCATEMAANINNTYFEEEMENRVFSKPWKAAKNCAERNMKKKQGDKALTKIHMQAICAYTAGEPENLYKTFNEAVRTNRAQYGSTFPFHSLHFWLTRAIQILKTNQNECYTTFRRTGATFTGEVNKEIRFGYFASTSKLSTLTRFGETTCFEIRTCHGAYLKKYPKLGDREQEVLIPPYETFKIISKDKPPELDDCDNVYILNSTGVQSNLDCQLVNQILL